LATKRGVLTLRAPAEIVNWNLIDYSKRLTFAVWRKLTIAVQGRAK